MIAPPLFVWKPLPGPRRGLPSSQNLALSCPANEILYDGTRGGGKTDCQLMRFRRNVGKGYGKFWRGILLDLEFKSLDDLVAKSLRWFPEFKDGARWLSSASDYKWVWPSGEELLFRQMKAKRDYQKYHGHEYPFIGWNELTKQKSPELYELMLSCNRSSFVPEDHPVPVKDHKGKPTGEMRILPPLPLEVFSTTNPHGIGHNWVKKHFQIGKVPPGTMTSETIEVFNPRTRTMEKITRTRCRIFSSYKENVHLDPNYIVTLTKIRDPNRRKAWLEGNWDITAGGALDDLWADAVHILPRFHVPHSWKVDRALDWGSSHPCAVGWWAEANGEEARVPESVRFPNGLWCPPKGTLISIAELYLSKPDGDGSITGTNEGRRLGPKVVAKKILEVDRELKAGGWYGGQILSGPADNQIGNVQDSETDTIEKRMADIGVRWTSSDKGAGTRVMGLELIRERMGNSLDWSVDPEILDPGIYWTENCRASIETLPFLPRDEENEDDVDTDAEDHAYDQCRYRVLKAGWRPASRDSLKVEFTT